MYSDLRELIRHNLNPTTDEAIQFWAAKDEPTDIELILIDWHPEIYHTHRQEENESAREEYEF